MADRLLTVQEVAALLGRSEGALRFQLHKDVDAPPSALVMGRRVFRESDVQAWLDAKFAASGAVAS